MNKAVGGIVAVGAIALVAWLGGLGGFGLGGGGLGEGAGNGEAVPAGATVSGEDAPKDPKQAQDAFVQDGNLIVGVRGEDYYLGDRQVQVVDVLAYLKANPDLRVKIKDEKATVGAVEKLRVELEKVGISPQQDY